MGASMRSRRNGYTLIELTVAVSLGAMILTLLALSWSGLTRHIYSSGRISRLRVDADRIVGAVTTAVRRSPRVLAYSDGSVTLTTHAHDTLVYRLGYDSVLYRNEVAMAPGADDARVEAFGVKRIDEGGMVDEGSQNEQVLLEVYLRLAGPDGRSVSASQQTSATAARDGGVWGWGF